MDNKEILEKVKREKSAQVGEMEKQKTNKGNWIAVIIAGVIAVALMIIEGALGRYTSIFAIGSICHAWACTIYTCQYVLAKRPWQVLIGAVLHGLAFVAMIVFYVLFTI